jgi:hypothetical protein
LPGHVTPKHGPWLASLSWAGSRLLALAGLLSGSRPARLIVGRLLLLVGLVMQVVLLLVAGYLIDMAISLMDLWLELARKHLELTL